jgi:hypothetical protein
MNMRKPISITLEEANLIWLKGQAGTTSKGSVSEVIDSLVTEARLQGRTRPGAIRSVAGSIDLPDDDPDLAGADVYVRTLFDKSLRRPMPVRERRARKGGRRRG